MSEKPIVLSPGSLPQEQFLLSDSIVTLYSGSAGAGKTFAIILNIIKFLLEKNSTIVVFRRTTTQLKSGGGIWREAAQVIKQYFGKDVIVRERDMEIFVPGTNSICKFSHLQYVSDVDNHLSAQYSAIFFDEATTFDPFEDFILPLMGRLRNANVSYTPQMFWATNPRFNHGIYHWIKDFYLDNEGIPYKERSNVERYFVLESGKPVWFDRREDAEKIYGTGADNGVLSFRSIRAHVTDNVRLLENQPGYISNLKAMSAIKQRIYLDGSWTAREEEAGLYQRAWSKVIPYPNLKAKKRVRAWDLASMPVSSATPSPDWTRGILMSKDGHGRYVVEDVVSIRDRPHVVEQLILETAEQDRHTYGNVIVSYPRDPGQAGIARASDMKRQLAERGISCRIVIPQKSKRTRFLAVSAIAEAGFLDVVAADWNDEWFKELEEFSGLVRGEVDDQCDATSDCVLVLNQGIELPTNLILPDLSKQQTSVSVVNLGAPENYSETFFNQGN